MGDRKQARKVANRIFIAKRRRRRKLAELTIEQKMEAVARMQRIAREISAMRIVPHEGRRPSLTI